MTFTVIGAGGFIGGHLMARLRQDGFECLGGGREFLPEPGRHYGHIIYTAGLTADFRQRPLETVEAHVCTLKRWLERASFGSLLYLSSTRVYQHAESTAEDAALRVNPSLPGDLYNLSKLMGESLCLGLAGQGCRIVRLSNVIDPEFTPGNFLGSVVNEAVENGIVTFQGARDSEKDFVALDDVLDLLPRLAIQGRQAIYNLASGSNLSYQRIAHLLKEELDCGTSFTPNAPRHWFPPVSMQRLNSEFGHTPRDAASVIRKALTRHQKARQQAAPTHE